MIFPCGWNDSGWTKTFVALKGIIEPIDDSTGHRSHDPSSTLVALNLASPSLPQLPPVFCPQCGFIGESVAFLQSLAAIVTSPAHVAFPSSSPVAFSSLDDTSATPNDRLLSEGRTECLDLLCASKGCSPPALELETFDASRFEVDIVSHCNDFSKAPLECVFSEGCMPGISSVPSGPLLAPRWPWLLYRSVSRSTVLQELGLGL